MKSINLPKKKKNMKMSKTPKKTEELCNEEILREAQAKIIARGTEPDYPLERQWEDCELIAELTLLIRKCRNRR